MFSDILEANDLKNKIHNYRIIIFGENHGNDKERLYYYDIIKQFKPEYLLHELLYEDISLTSSVIQDRLNKCDKENLCDSRYNKDIYEFGLKSNIKLVGIDINDIPNAKQLSTRDKFKIREAHMIKIIDRYSGSKICVVVGDTHLRKIETKELGSVSPIYEKYKDKALIIRSKHR